MNRCFAEACIGTSSLDEDVYAPIIDEHRVAVVRSTYGKLRAGRIIGVLTAVVLMGSGTSMIITPQLLQTA